MSTPIHYEPVPQITPNVVVADPRVRKVVNIVLGVSALVLPIAGMIDRGVTEFNFDPWLMIAGEINLFLVGVFNLGVINPNIPSATFDRKVERQMRAEGMNGGRG
jgi:hypothetical protein